MPLWITLLLALLLPQWARAAPVAVAAGVYLQRDSFQPGRQPDGNSVVFVGPRGLVVVDTGRHIEHTQALIDFAAARAAPIVAVVNSHWHLDHLGGNALLRERVPTLQVVASSAVAPALKGWLANSRREMQAMLDGGTLDATTQTMVRGDIALIDRGPKLLPDVVVDGTRTLELGGLPLQIGHEARAVTAGDLWVYEPNTRVLAAGDLVTLPVPFLDTACASGWSAALSRLDSVPFTTLVPGHGAPMSRQQFGTWRGAFDGLLACAASQATDMTCSEGWVKALGDLLPVAEHKRAQAMVGYYLQHRLRAAPVERDRYCSAGG
ncbi:MBL fold metallo-hydrolase [Ideonella sp. A 288]|uniref:MBL fold metallo-hydrolase n=1 Tax=Ideonella sp. A 288 TaxID=1962181 RepID=UPI000B4B98F6|nr:MBL fold metallo-hydrolase [Ideonella sp. A 288]